MPVYGDAGASARHSEEFMQTAAVPIGKRAERLGSCSTFRYADFRATCLLRQRIHDVSASRGVLSKSTWMSGRRRQAYATQVEVEIGQLVPFRGVPIHSVGTKARGNIVSSKQ